MGLLAPLALGFLPLLAIIVALYLLRLRRPETAVSSLYLWDSLLRDREANAPWQRLNASLLLLLQLLVAAALILALARPWAAVPAAGGRNLVLVIDTSASMGATDAGVAGTASGGRTRLSEAVRLAWTRITTLPTNGTAAIIAAGADARVIAPATGDRAALRQALDSLAVAPTPTDLAPAFALAAGLLAAASDPEVDVYSDGRFPDPRRTVPSLAAPVHFVPVGSESANQAIVALDLRRDAGSFALFVQVLNTADTQVTRRLDIDLDDVAWSGRTLTLAPGVTTQVVVDDVPAATQVAHVHLAGADALAVDDDGWAVNRQSEPAPVLLVTDGNRFLQNALVLLPDVSLSRTAPATYAPLLTATLTVFDRTVPSDTLPAGNLLFVDPPKSTALFGVSGVLTNPVALPAGAPVAAGAAGDSLTPGPGSGDPLLRFTDLSDVHVAQAMHIDPPGWARVVLGSRDAPLILAGEADGRRVVIFTFDLHDSDLPVQTAFPLLMRNIVGYLLPPAAGGLTASATPGASVDLAADVQDGVDRLTVSGPTGDVLATYPVRPDSYRFTFDGTTTPGVYAVSQWAGTQEVRREGFAVNLFSEDESRIGPRAAPPLPRGRPAPGEDTGSAQFEWWQAAAAVALLALVGEWLLIHRLGLRRLGRWLVAWRRGESFGSS